MKAPNVVSYPNLVVKWGSNSWSHCSHQVTMQDYRNEVKEFFVGDEQLAAEVEFALKTAEKEKEMEEQMENCNLTGEPKTPTAQVRTQQVSLVVFTVNSCRPY